MNSTLCFRNPFFAWMPFLVLIMFGCGGNQKQIEEIPQDERVVSKNTTLFNIDNKLFYMPNPVQTALLMKEIAAPFSKEILNPTNKIEKYNTSFKQAVNIGVYGADLGYITANNQNQEALSHLGAVKKLSDELGVSSSFNFGELEKFGNNAGNQQEMLGIITTAYKGCEEFLRKDGRHDIAGLIMAGALVESLYFAVHFASMKNNQDVINRIGEQMRSIDNIILILNPHYSKTDAPEFSDFVDKLVDLQTQFQVVKFNYTFKESTVDEGKKLCTVNCATVIEMSDMVLKTITDKIKSIRESITS